MNKRLFPLFLFLMIFFINTLGVAQEYTIANWLGNKEAAVSLTFDDWSQGQQTLAVPELNKRQIKATFFINGQRDYAKLIELAKQGHEVGNHSVSHQDISTFTAEKFQQEVFDFQHQIDQNITSQRCVTFAYPFGGGANNQKVINSIKKTHVAARGVYQVMNSFDPRLSYDFAKTENDYYNTNVVSVSRDSAFYAGMLDKVIAGGGHISFLYHAFHRGGYDFISMNRFKQQLTSLEERSDRLWVTTYSNAMRYHREKNCATLTEINPPFTEKNSWKLNLSDTLVNNIVYNQELTINLEKPVTVKSVSKITQNGQRIAFTIKDDVIVFNAIPDHGEIILSIQ